MDVESTGFIAGNSSTSLISDSAGHHLKQSVQPVHREKLTDGVGQKHDQAVDSQAPPACRRKTMLEAAGFIT